MPAIDLGLLSAMITPAVLISACGQLIFSTSTRLARIVDRVRQLTPLLEQLFAGEVHEFADERRRQILDPNEFLTMQPEELLDDVLQLTHVSGPPVAFEHP